MITNSRIAYGLRSLQVTKEWVTFASLALASQRQKSRWMISGLAFILSLDIAPKSSIEEQVQSPLQGELQSLRAKNTASLRRIKIAHRNNTQLYLCQTTISRYNLQIRGGIHQISTQQQTRTTYANEIKKPTLSLNLLLKIYSRPQDRHI